MQYYWATEVGLMNIGNGDFLILKNKSVDEPTVRGLATNSRSCDKFTRKMGMAVLTRCDKAYRKKQYIR